MLRVCLALLALCTAEAAFAQSEENAAALQRCVSPELQGELYTRARTRPYTPPENFQAAAMESARCLATYSAHSAIMNDRAMLRLTRRTELLEIENYGMPLGPHWIRLNASKTAFDARGALYVPALNAYCIWTYRNISDSLNNVTGTLEGCRESQTRRRIGVQPSIEIPWLAAHLEPLILDVLDAAIRMQYRDDKE